MICTCDAFDRAAGNFCEHCIAQEETRIYGSYQQLVDDFEAIITNLQKRT
jgi:hypothetical protein